MRIVYHPRCLEHRQADRWHPESPDRLAAVRARLESDGLWKEIFEPEPADIEQCLRAHGAGYLEMLRSYGEGVWDADTYVRDETFELALLAAGGACLAAAMAWEEERPTLSLCRPPGHHATPDRAMGFCYLNNVAIAALDRIARGARRVAIVDVDVHHGNGTQDILYHHGDILFVSLHQWPLYPGTGAREECGEGPGEGRTVNIPLPPRSGDATYQLAMKMLIEPVLTQFRPDLILVSLGVDAHAMDPLGGTGLSSSGYVDLVNGLWTMASALCRGRMACILEGGYHLDALADVIAGVVGKARGKKVRLTYRESADTQGAGRSAVKEAARVAGRYWELPPHPHH